jgi:hypothetical protein
MSIHRLSGTCVPVLAIAVAIASGVLATDGIRDGADSGPGESTPVDPMAPQSQDARLIGAWKPLTYQIQGKDHPMEGLMLFSDRYFSSNVLFQTTGGPLDDGNMNAGPYEADGRRVVFMQWVQVHIRPGDPKEPLLVRKGEPEPAEYLLDGDRLEIIFPSQNRFILQRLEK